MGNLISLPFAALLRWMYSFTGSYGWSIILFALIIKVVLLPFQMKSKRNMVRMGRLSGRQQELQKQYANNQQKYQEELSKLYQEAGVNPMGGCLWSLLPLFIIYPSILSFIVPLRTSCVWEMKVLQHCARWRSLWAMTARSTPLPMSRSV